MPTGGASLACTELQASQADCCRPHVSRLASEMDVLSDGMLLCNQRQLTKGVLSFMPHYPAACR